MVLAADDASRQGVPPLPSPHEPGWPSLRIPPPPRAPRSGIGQHLPAEQHQYAAARRHSRRASRLRPPPCRSRIRRAIKTDGA